MGAQNVEHGDDDANVADLTATAAVATISDNKAIIKDACLIDYRDRI